MAIEALPRIPMSRLLKSCATPPASRPMLSSFCDSHSRWSICLRSVMSVTIATPPRSSPLASVMGSTVIAKERSPITLSTRERFNLCRIVDDGLIGGGWNQVVQIAAGDLAGCASEPRPARRHCSAAPCRGHPAARRRRAMASNVDLPVERRIAHCLLGGAQAQQRAHRGHQHRGFDGRRDVGIGAAVERRHLSSWRPPVEADICSTGVEAVSGAALMRPHTSTPLISGRRTSSSTRSGSSAETRRRASLPVPASMTS